jgi:hypothetical protein
MAHTHFPDCACRLCVEEVDPMRELVEAAIALWYAWETRQVHHPDHPISVRIWNQRMAVAGTRLREALIQAKVIDERIARSQTGLSAPSDD